MKLLNPTDDELDAAFAEKVAGYVKSGGNAWIEPVTGALVIRFPIGPGLPRFTHSADAVLLWLEKHYIETDWIGGPVRHYTGKTGDACWRVRVPGKFDGEVEDVSFPRAAVIALLRAKGVEVEFTDA